MFVQYAHPCLYKLSGAGHVSNTSGDILLAVLAISNLDTPVRLSLSVLTVTDRWNGVLLIISTDTWNRALFMI